MRRDKLLTKINEILFFLSFFYIHAFTTLFVGIQESVNRISAFQDKNTKKIKIISRFFIFFSERKKKKLFDILYYIYDDIYFQSREFKTIFFLFCVSVC